MPAANMLPFIFLYQILRLVVQADQISQDVVSQVFGTGTCKLNEYPALLSPLPAGGKKHFPLEKVNLTLTN